MRLTIRLLGTEVLYIDTDPPPAPERPGDGEGVEVSRHQGLFELGFQPAASWSHVERDADGP